MKVAVALKLKDKSKQEVLDFRAYNMSQHEMFFIHDCDYSGCFESYYTNFHQDYI